MLTTQTLVGIACLIANKGPIDTTGIEAQLGQQERIAVESIIQSGTCLPENLEKLLLDTELKIRNDLTPKNCTGKCVTFLGAEEREQRCQEERT